MIGWIDASSGASGDMLLGALVGAGVPLEVLQRAVDEVTPEPVSLRVEEVTRAGIAATRVHVEVARPDSEPSHRTWRDIRPLLTDDTAVATFTRLAEAEAAVHRSDPADVHFHEVGALDAIADVVAACAGFAHLGLTGITVSTIAVGGGRVQAAHGSLPVPAPAVAMLLADVPTVGGPVEQELCTPTGAALLREHATGFGAQPAMRATTVGVGAGGRDPEGHPNVLRLFLGEPVTPVVEEVAQQPPSALVEEVAQQPRSALVEEVAQQPSRNPTGRALVIETNVDDLDPRMWPDVIRLLMEAGASDAWLTPIVMKKGRPAHTLHALVGADRADAVRREIFRQTSTIGVREREFAKHALDRETRQVEVDGQVIDVKLARLDGELMNLAPEYDHVVAAAAALGRPIKDVLAAATAAARAVVNGTDA